MKPLSKRLKQLPLLVLVGATAQCTDIAAPGRDGARPLYLVGPGIVRFPMKHTEMNRHILRGKSDSLGGCVFTSTDTLAKGERIFESVREIDPLNCVAIVARHPITEAPAHAQPKVKSTSRTGSWPNPEMNSAIQYEETESSELWAEAFQSGGGGGGISTNSQLPCSEEYGLDKGMFQNLWHEDPFDIWVTKSNHTGYFFYDGQCVQYVNHTSYIQWRTATGWRLHQHDIAFVWYGIQTVDMNSFSELQNDLFCPDPATTIVKYVPNQLRVFHDGYWTTNWTWHWSGGCSGWLTPKRLAGVW